MENETRAKTHEIEHSDRKRGNEPILPHPRKECTRDLIKFINLRQQDNHGIVLVIHAHETPTESTNADVNPKKDSIEYLFEECQLEDKLHMRHGEIPSTSTIRENRYIDCIGIWGIPFTKAG